jgi:hypothetical protein
MGAPALLGSGTRSEQPLFKTRPGGRATAPLFASSSLMNSHMQRMVPTASTPSRPCWWKPGVAMMPAIRG